MLVERKYVGYEKRLGETSTKKGVQPPKEASVVDPADGFRRIVLVRRP